MSIANDVRIYFRNKPYMLEAIEKDIANLSKLARVVQDDLNLNSTRSLTSG